MTRPLTHDETEKMLEAAKKLAQTLGRAIGVLGTAQDIGYPTVASSYQKQRHNATELDDNGRRIPVQPDTVPERHATRPDPLLAQAAMIGSEVRRITQLLYDLQADAAGWDPQRAVLKCPRCKEPIQANWGTECRRYYNGTRCGQEPAVRTCKACGDDMEDGQPLRNGRCDKCRKRHDRAVTVEQNRGTSTFDVQDTTGMLTPEQTASSAEPTS